ncbi:MAG: glycosyltransferase 87 family protein [Mycobacterium sp.]
MSRWRSPDVGSWRGRAATGLPASWGMLGLLVVAALGYWTWRVFEHTSYRIDVDVYRMGAQAWRDGHQLYGDVLFKTWLQDTPLPFTYPPIAAVLFTPFTWLSLRDASLLMTIVSAALLVVSTAILLTSLGVCTAVRPPTAPAWWRRGCLATAIVVAAIALNMEPIWSNFGYGQINVVVMTLVMADCLPQRTRWPRGLLLGIAISVKLTPAVALIYLVLRRQGRAALTALVTFVASVLVAFVLTPRDSWEYWTRSLFHTNRIGDTALNTNQNFAGVLARMGLTGGLHFVVWATACTAALALTVWAVRRLLGADEPALALMCAALLALLVSPVSWSHHWVWALPTIVALAVVGYRRRSPVVLGLAGAGLALMRWSPIRLLLEHSNLREQLIGAAYVWWALAVIAITGLTVTARQSARETEPGPAVDAEAAGAADEPLRSASPWGHLPLAGD